MASLLLPNNNTTPASTTTTTDHRLHRHHHHHHHRRCKLHRCCEFGIVETQQVVVVMTRKLSYIRRINPSPSAHSFLFVLLLLFQLLSHVVVLSLSLSSPISVSSLTAKDPVAISALVKSSSSPPSITTTTTTDVAFHHLSEYNEWRASVENKKIQEAISPSTSSETGERKDTISVSNSSSTDKDGSLSPLFENAFASTSASRRNSLDEILSTLDIDNSERTTLDLLIGDDTNLFTEDSNSSQPIASTSAASSARLSLVANQTAASSSLAPPSNMRQQNAIVAATISTQKQAQSQFRHVLPSLVPSSSSQIQKKEKKKRGRNKNPENPLLMLMRAAQQLAPNFVLPILKNKSSQLKAITASSSSSLPPKLTPKETELTKDDDDDNGNSFNSKYNDKHMEMEMPILSPSSPLLGRMVEPERVVPQHPTQRQRQVSSSTATATVTDLNQRKNSTASLSSVDTNFSSSSEDFTNDSHNAPTSDDATDGSRPKLVSVMPDPLLSYSSGDETDSTEQRPVSLIPPASFIIESLPPLYHEFNTNNFKGLMLRKKRLPSFHTIKKRRLPRSIFVEVQGENKWKRYKIEGDKDEKEDIENKAPVEESRLALIRKRRNALYFNMLQNRLEGQRPLQQQTQQQRYPFPYPGVNLPQYNQRSPTSVQNRPVVSQPSIQSGQLNQLYNFEPQQRPQAPQTPTSGSPVRSQWSSPQTVQNLSPLRQQLSRGPINTNNQQLRMSSNTFNNYGMPTAQSSTPPPNVQIVPSTSGDDFLFKTPLPVVSRPSSRLESRLTSSSPSPFQQQANIQRNLSPSQAPQFMQQRPTIRQEQRYPSPGAGPQFMQQRPQIRQEQRNLSPSPAQQFMQQRPQIRQEQRNPSPGAGPQFMQQRPQIRQEQRNLSPSPAPQFMQQRPQIRQELRNLSPSPTPQFMQQRPPTQQGQSTYPFQSQQSRIAPNTGQQYPYMRGPMSPRPSQQQNSVYNQNSQQQQRYQNPQYFNSAQSGPPRYSPPRQYSDIPARPGPSGTPFTAAGQMPLANNYFQNQARHSQLTPSPQMQTVPNQSRVSPMTSYGGSSSSGPFYRNQGENLGTRMNQQYPVRVPATYSSPQQAPQMQQSLYPMQNRLYNDDGSFRFGRTGIVNTGRFETPSYTTSSPGYPRDTASSPINQANVGQYRGTQGYTSPVQPQWRQPEWPVGPRAPGPTAYSRVGLGQQQQQPQYYGQSSNYPIQGQVGLFPNQQGPGKLGDVDRKTPGPSQIQQQASEQPTQPQRYFTPSSAIEGTDGRGWTPYQRNNAEQRAQPAQQGSNSEFNVYPKYFTSPQQQPRYPSPQPQLSSPQPNLAPTNTQQLTQLERKQDTPIYGSFEAARPPQQPGQQNMGNQAPSLAVGGSQFAPSQQQNAQRAEGIPGYQYSQQQPSYGRFTPSQRQEGVPTQQQHTQRVGSQTPSLGDTQNIQSHEAPSPSPKIQQQTSPRVGIPKPSDTSSVGGSQYKQSHVAPVQDTNAGRIAAPGQQGNQTRAQPHAQAGNTPGPSHSAAYEQLIRSTTTPAPAVISGGERVLFRSKPSGSQSSPGGSGGSFDRPGGTTQGAGGAGTGRGRGEFTLPIIENPQEKSQLQKQPNNGPTNQRPIFSSSQYLQQPSDRQGQQGSNSEADRSQQKSTSTQQFASTPQQQSTPTRQFSSSTQQQSTPTQQFSSSPQRQSTPAQQFTSSPQQQSNPIQQFTSSPQQQSNPIQQFISTPKHLEQQQQQQQQQQQPRGGYGGGNFTLAGGNSSIGPSSGKPQHLLDTSDRGLNNNVGAGLSTSWGPTGDSNNNGRETPQAQRGGERGDGTISRIQSGAEKGSQKTPETQPQQVEKAQIGKHLPHHGGDLPFYSQSELDAHHERVSHNSQTAKDTEFENDSAILSWYLQRAKQELRHRQKSGRHKEPEEETRQRAQTTGFGSPSNQPRVRSATFQPGDTGKAQFRVTHPYSSGASGDRPTTPFYNAAATSQQTQNSPFRRLSQVSYPSQMVQTSSNSQEIHSSAPSSGYQSYANQNGILALSQPRPASASPASSSSVQSQGSTALHSYGSYPGTGTVQQLNNPTRPNSTNPWYYPS